MNHSPAQPDDSSPESTPGSTSSDAELARDWRDLFAEVEPGLRAFLRGRLKQPADVEDCLQSVSVAMLEKGRDVAPPARRAWLFRVAANEAARFWRDKSTTDRVLEKQATYTTQDGFPEPTDRLEQNETLEEIEKALASLPMEWQVVIRMRIHDGLTFQKIADELGIPLGTALTRMRRGLQQVRESLAPTTDNDARTTDENSP